jgi:hypothetical protein
MLRLFFVGPLILSIQRVFDGAQISGNDTGSIGAATRRRI